LWRSGIQPNTALQSLTTSFDIAVGLIATFLDKLGWNFQNKFTLALKWLDFWVSLPFGVFGRGGWNFSTRNSCKIAAWLSNFA